MRRAQCACRCRGLASKSNALLRDWCVLVFWVSAIMLDPLCALSA
ncbi:hypothetical protein HMPREF0281_01816 [Corynebacterium ammoniagenes DSM 20306]|uniref:Uncharacterized protein n=1 Tax=Corynebacterium ammoniagenes DSM 20306 TaxID=649754 RepID=A0ABN0ADP6_CORAM|nr:hypothetical protein HMPREF0281_01816 [Corynebacterium ammoniagenes DSM 20306]